MVGRAVPARRRTNPVADGWGQPSPPALGQAQNQEEPGRGRVLSGWP